MSETNFVKNSTSTPDSFEQISLNIICHYFLLSNLLLSSYEGETFLPSCLFAFSFSLLVEKIICHTLRRIRGRFFCISSETFAWHILCCPSSRIGHYSPLWKISTRFAATSCTEHGGSFLAVEGIVSSSRWLLDSI